MTKFSRRQAVKGLSTLAFLPFLDSLRVHAAGKESALPKRFVFVIKSSGLEKFNLVPDGLENYFIDNEGNKLGNRSRREGPLVDVSLQQHKLPEKLQILNKYKDRLTIIQSLSGVGFRGNHTKGLGTLSLHDSEMVAVAPTLDCILGRHLSKGPYPMYGMAMNGRLLESGWKPEDNFCYPNLSAYGPGKPVAFQASPRKAYLDLFGAAIANPKELQKDMNLNRNLMDFLREDAKRVEKNLNAEERERFALYKDSFESLKMIGQKKVALLDEAKASAPKLTNLYDSKTPADRIKAHFEIGTAALIAGLTNVITLRPDTLGVKYSSLGLSESVHNIGHLGENKTNKGWTGYEARMEVEKLHYKYIADMAAKFDAIPEGNGTMLDNTMIVYMSCSSGAHHCGGHDWPFVLLGGMAKKIKMGRYIEYPKYGTSGHRTVSGLYLSLLQAAGLKTADTFGQADSNLKDLDLKGPLKELMV